MGTTRHWKQHWDPSAQLVFARRMRLGDNPKKPFMLPGERLTKAQRAKLGENRVRRWFETGMLEIEGWKAPEPQREKALQAEEAARDERLAEAAEELSPETEEPDDREEIEAQIDAEIKAENAALREQAGE